MKVIIVTGLSGAGKTQAMDVLEVPETEQAEYMKKLGL